MMKRSRLLVTVALTLATAAAAAAAETTHTKLYILSSAGNDMTVVDVATHEILGTVEVGDRPHGIAAPASDDLLYVSAEFENTLTVVDPLTDTVTKRYPMFGNRPNEIDVTSDGRIVYLPILGHGVYEVFDTRQEHIVERIATNGLPHNVVISPDDRYAYLAPMDRGRAPVEAVAERGLPTTLNERIHVVDLRTHRVIDTIETGDAPRPIAISPDGKRLYANIDGLQGFLVIDLEQREVISRVAYELTEQERQQPSRSHGIVVVRDGREVWTVDVNLGLVFAFDVTRDPPVQVARMDNGDDPYWMTATPDGKTVYVASAPGDTVTAYDVASRRRKAVIQLPEGSAPKRMLVLEVPAGAR